jgi:hypothetical protein
LTRAAILRSCPGDLTIEDIEVDSPGQREVLIQTVADAAQADPVAEITGMTGGGVHYRQVRHHVLIRHFTRHLDFLLDTNYIHKTLCLVMVR